MTLILEAHALFRQKAGESRRNATAAAFEVGHTLAMTEQESEVLGERLTRIWAERLISIEGPCNFDEDVIYHEDSEKGLMRATLEGTGEQVHVFVNDWAMMLRFVSGKHHHLLFVNCEGKWTQDPSTQSQSRKKQAVKERFEQSWIGPFRRAAWLCGFPLEASAHEKAEWMQGFRREEIDAWNLKM